MWWYRYNALLTILSFNYLIEIRNCAVLESNSFSRNWVILNGDKIVYSRNFNRRYEFAFANCEISKGDCEITLISTNSTKFSSKTCAFSMDRHFASISSVVIPSAKTKTVRVALVWLGRVRNGYSTFVTYVDFENCEKSNSYDSEADMRFPSTAEVLLYEYPIFVTIDKGRASNERSVSGFSFEDDAYHDIKVPNLLVNHSWIGKIQPLEIGATRGFFYVGSYDDNDEAWMAVEYANLTCQTITRLATISSHSESGYLHANPETSGAFDKYGLCWNDKNNKEIICTQLKHDGYVVVHKLIMRLTEAADWFALHNYKDDAMLVATGRCPLDKCDQFQVQKIHATGQKSVRFAVNGLDLHCTSSTMTLDISEDASKREICFNFVCLDKSNEQILQTKINAFLQYRRKCIARDIF